MAIVGASLVLGMPAQSFAQPMVTDDASALLPNSGNSLLPTADGSAGVVNTGALNIRSGPGIGHEVVTIAYQGTAVTLIGRHPENNWVIVHLNNGIEGWVNSVYISSSVPRETLPIFEDSQPPDPIPPTSSTTVVATGALNLRSSPDVASNIKTVLRRGDTLVPNGRNEDGSWLLVRSMSGVEGWVNASYVHVGLDVMELPLIPQAAVHLTEKIVLGAVNIRRGPAGDSESFSVLHQGQFVTLVGRSLDGEWIHIQIENGDTGWVSVSAFQDNLSAQDLPVVDASEPANPAVVTTGALNVRYGPGTDFGILTIIFKGDRVTMLGRALYSNWVQVQFSSGARGWVNSRYLSSNHSIDLLPIAWP